MNNSVRQLNVFGGMINNANVPYDVRFPYIIPKTFLYKIRVCMCTFGSVTQWCQRDINFYQVAVLDSTRSQFC